jgi:TPR repeat protein
MGPLAWWAAALLGAACVHTPSRAPTARASTETQGNETAPAASASAEPAKLPFRLPCDDTDVVGCTNGCNDGVREDCVTLASMYMKGAVVSVDRERALKMFRAACTEGSARGCMRLGDAYHEGILNDPAEETRLYRDACEAGANQGCVAAGRAYLAGRGVGADAVFAASLFKRVCDKGNAPACFELARLCERGEGVPRDAARAFELFSKACKLGHDEACLVASHTEEVLPPRE